ncbi:hypothetical protein TNCT_187581 [Trichonephila clavata]|uniref:Uncharacterized protein n=1 Tax=Trichonephila clavata TaxID=2740835 RepID=A0A8X6GFD3_TRICU|nr:hypothetical protein TNCT_187581 [Trichonephila clavata]
MEMKIYGANIKYDGRWPSITYYLTIGNEIGLKEAINQQHSPFDAGLLDIVRSARKLQSIALGRKRYHRLRNISPGINKIVSSLLRTKNNIFCD